MPGTWDMLKDDEVLITDSEFDSLMENCKEIPTTIDAEFNRDGRRWRVTVVVDTFIIATAVDAVLDSHREPSRSSDIIKVSI